MAKIAPAFFDNSGVHHPTPEAAVTADLAVIIAGTRAGPGVARSIAQVILAKRAEIEAVFAALDQMHVECAADVIRLGKAKAVRHG